MLHGRAMSSMPPSSATPSPHTGAVIRRLLRDYIGGQWGLLLLAILCMLERLHIVTVNPSIRLRRAMIDKARVITRIFG